MEIASLEIHAKTLTFYKEKMKKKLILKEEIKVKKIGNIMKMKTQMNLEMNKQKNKFAIIL